MGLSMDKESKNNFQGARNKIAKTKQNYLHKYCNPIRQLKMKHYPSVTYIKRKQSRVGVLP